MNIMENKIKERYGAYIHLASILLFILSSYYMYDFYKSLSGFIANQFREPLVMIPIFLSYFLPVFCFLFYFYDFFGTLYGALFYAGMNKFQ